MDDKKVQEFLQKIGQIESAGGKYTNHAVLDHGMHKGQSAYGTYGLMPNTIDEIAASSKVPEVQALADMDEAEKKSYLAQNPEVEQALARQLATKVLTRQGGDEQKAAYAWYNGHNLSPEKIASRDYIDSDYVKKYSKLADLVGAKPSKTPMSMEGTKDGDQVLSYLGGSPKDATAIAGTTGMGGSGYGETLKLNTDQRSQVDSALKDMMRSPASVPSTIGASYSSLLTPKLAVEPEELPPEVAHALQTPVAPPKALPFGSINKLIASYNKARK